MKSDEIRNSVLRIISQTDMEDLDIEVFPDVFPGNRNEIGKIFIYDDKLYLGETVGEPDYVCIGNCADLVSVLYRYYPDDRIIEFVFDFGKYRIAERHEEYVSDKLSLYDCSRHEWVMKDISVRDSVSVTEKLVADITEGRAAAENGSMPNHALSENE